MINIKTIVLRNGTEFMADVLEEEDNTLTFKYGMTCLLGTFDQSGSHTLRPFAWPINADISIPITIMLDDVLCITDVRPEAMIVYNNFKKAILEHDSETSN